MGFHEVELSAEIDCLRQELDTLRRENDHLSDSLRIARDGFGASMGISRRVLDELEDRERSLRFA